MEQTYLKKTRTYGSTFGQLNPGIRSPAAFSEHGNKA
jgi:hypothetical protein